MTAVRTIVTSILAVTIAILTIPTGPKVFAGISDSPPIGSTDSGAVEYSIVGHRFLIPRAYVNFQESSKGRRVDLTGGPGFGVTMEGVAPDLAPYGGQSKPNSSTAPRGRQIIRFHLWAITVGSGIKKKYFTPEFLGTCRGERRGLRLCPHSIFPKHRVILVRIDGDRKIAWDCGFPGETKESVCHALFPLIDRVIVQVSFHYMNLARHEAIVARVFELVCAFYRPGGTGAVTHNHCEKGTYHAPKTENRIDRRPQ